MPPMPTGTPTRRRVSALVTTAAALATAGAAVPSLASAAPAPTAPLPTLRPVPSLTIAPLPTLTVAPSLTLLPAPVITVNRTADAPDSAIGDGTCWASAAGGCTLRAAVQEANARAGANVVTVPAGTYTLTSTLFVEDDTTINGASAATTVISGGRSVLPLWVRTVEYLVCDSANDRLVSRDRNGASNGTFTSTGAGGLDAPLAAHEIWNDDAVSPRLEDILVTGTSGVHRFTASGGHEAKLVDAPAAGIPFPSDAVAGPSNAGNLSTDSIHLADYYPSGVVRRYSQTGASLGTAVAHGSGGLQTPNSLAVRAGTLYVTDASSDKVLRYDATTYAYQGSSITGDTPRGIAFRPDGSFVVANWGADTVTQYSASGTYLGMLVAPGAGGLDKPTAVAMGPDNSLLVLSNGSSPRKVLQYDLTTGAFRKVWASGGTSSLNSPSCLMRREGKGTGANVTLNRVTIADGQASLGQPGGMVVDHGATVRVVDSVVRDNKGSTFGGGIGSWGHLTLLRTAVKGNRLPQGGGGVTSTGGGVHNAGTLIVDRSSITGNLATRGGGLAQSNGLTRITNSTISGNTASGGSGGAIRNIGTGRYEIAFSTITGNTTAPVADGDATRRGGGVFNEGASARIWMAGTVLAGNTDGRSAGTADYGPDCWSTSTYTFTSERSNLLGILSPNCSFRDAIHGTATFGNQVGTPAAPLSPGLGSLTWPAGTVTGVHRATSSTSKVVDKATSVSSSPLSTCPSTDQLGTARPVDGNGDGTASCDVGAVERTP